MKRLRTQIERAGMGAWHKGHKERLEAARYALSDRMKRHPISMGLLFMGIASADDLFFEAGETLILRLCWVEAVRWMAFHPLQDLLTLPPLNEAIFEIPALRLIAVI